MVRNGALLFTCLLCLSSSAFAEEQAAVTDAPVTSIGQNEPLTSGMIVTQDCEDVSKNIEIGNVPPKGILVTGCEELPAPDADRPLPAMSEPDNNSEPEE